MHKNNSSAMKRLIAGLSATFVMALSGLAPTPSYSQDTVRGRFYCGETADGIPATIFQRSLNGENIPIFIWESGSFISSGWTPLKRCQEVSDRFEKLRQENILNRITSGEINGQPVICVVKDEDEHCTYKGLLLTLKDISNTQMFLKQKFRDNVDIPVDNDGVGILNRRKFVCLSRSASGNCSGLLFSIGENLGISCSVALFGVCVE